MPCAHTHRHRGTRGTEHATLQVAGPAASHTPPPGPTEAVRQAAASLLLLLLLRHTWLNRDNGGCSLQPRTSPRDQARWEAARGQDQGISQGEGRKALESEQGWGREEVLAPGRNAAERAVEGGVPGRVSHARLGLVCSPA